MLHTILVILLATGACAQTMVEHAAAAAGGSVGGVAGKKVSDGVSNILGTVDKQAKKGAETSKNAPDALFEVGPGVPKADQGVPPPPPARRTAAAKLAAAPAPPPAPVVAPIPVAPPPPPPPAITAEDLRGLTMGTNRAEVLKLGPASSRITMFEDGHLIEVFRYTANDVTVGVVRLTDGAVSSVTMQ